MGGSSKQTVGYKYFAGLQVVIGNCIEYMININPDNRGWIFTKPEEIDQLKTGDTSITVKKPNLFGGDKAEGGWVGIIDIHTGKPETLRQNEYLAEQDSQLISAYPYLSYLVFRGTNEPNLEIGWDLSNFGMQSGFQLVSMSGMLKDVLYWPKRTRIKDDGSEQWYKIRSTDYAVVCEIGATFYSSFDENQIGDSLDSRVIWSEYRNGNLELSNENFISKELVREGIIAEGAGGKVYFGNLEDDDYGEVSTEVSLKTLGGLSGICDVYVEILTYGSNTSFITSGFQIKNIEQFPAQYEGRVKIYGLAKVDSIIEVKSNASGIITVNPQNPIKYLGNTVAISLENIRSGEYVEPEALDINPIHKIREIITDDTAMNKPESMINDANFKAAADRIWDEGLGVSGSFTEKSCKEAIDELLYHIEAGIRVNRQTGLYEIVLFRDDLLDLDNAQLFDKSNIKNFSIETANIDDVINSVNVNYYDRDNIKDSSFSLDELGSILSNQSNAETLDFPYFMNRRNAELVGNWKLKQLSTPTRKGSFTTGKYDARKINRYDVVKLTWQNQNMIEVPVRIMKIGLGDGRDNTVTLDWVEVIPYSSIVFPTINVDPPTSNILPPQPNSSIAFEMPYYEAVQNFGQTQVDAELANNPDLGYVAVASKKPQNNSLNALLYTDVGTGYTQQSIVNYCPNAQLDQAIGYLDTSFAIKNIDSLSSVAIGSAFICGSEIMIYESFDTNTSIITVKRGALDTVPAQHAIDSVIWFYDEYPNYDTTQYVDGEIVDAKVLTTTPSGVQELADATVLSVEMDARPIRPYPPANVKINDEYYPIEIATDLIVTWVDRNRLQQTGGSILGWTDGGVIAESGLTYHLELHNLDTSTDAFNSNIGLVNTYSFSSLSPANYRIRLYSVRDSYNSYQMFEHNIQIAANDKLLQEDGTSYLLLESGDFILLEQ